MSTMSLHDTQHVLCSIKDLSRGRALIIEWIELETNIFHHAVRKAEVPTEGKSMYPFPLCFFPTHSMTYLDSPLANPMSVAHEGRMDGAKSPTLDYL